MERVCDPAAKYLPGLSSSHGGLWLLVGLALRGTSLAA
jgi:hypothetical protein